MHDGFDITFREVVPESGIVELVVAELQKMHPHEGLHCSVVVSRAGSEETPFDVHVELRAHNVGVGLQGYAVDNDQYYALRQAFNALRDAQTAQTPSAASGTYPTVRGHSLRAVR